MAEFVYEVKLEHLKTMCSGDYAQVAVGEHTMNISVTPDVAIRIGFLERIAANLLMEDPDIDVALALAQELNEDEQEKETQEEDQEGET